MEAAKRSTASDNPFGQLGTLAEGLAPRVEDHVRIEYNLPEILEEPTQSIEEGSRIKFMKEISASDLLGSNKTTSQEPIKKKPKAKVTYSIQKNKNAVYIHNQFKKLFDNFTNEDPRLSNKDHRAISSSKKLRKSIVQDSCSFKSASPTRFQGSKTPKLTLFSSDKASPQVSEKSELAAEAHNSSLSVRKLDNSGATVESTLRPSLSHKLRSKLGYEPITGYNFKRKANEKAAKGKTSKPKEGAKGKPSSQLSRPSNKPVPPKITSTQSQSSSPFSNINLKPDLRVAKRPEATVVPESRVIETPRPVTEPKPTLSQTMKALEVKTLHSPSKTVSQRKQTEPQKPKTDAKPKFDEVRHQITSGSLSKFVHRAEQERKESKYRFTSMDDMREPPKTAEQIAMEARLDQNKVLEQLRTIPEGKNTQEASIMSKLLEVHSLQQRQHRLKLNLNTRFHQSMTKQCSFLSSNPSAVNS